MTIQKNVGVIASEVMDRFLRSSRSAKDLHQNLFDIWKVTLNASTLDDYQVIEGIGEVHLKFVTLQKQVSSSKNLSSPVKKSVNFAISKMLPYFDIPTLFTPISRFGMKYTEDDCSMVTLAGTNLTQEYPDRIFDSKESEDIIAVLQEVKNMLAGSSLDLGLSNYVSKNIDLLIWWLKSPGAFTVDNVVLSICGIALAARQICEKLPQESDERRESNILLERLQNLFNKILAKQKEDSGNIISNSTEHSEPPLLSGP